MNISYTKVIEELKKTHIVKSFFERLKSFKINERQLKMLRLVTSKEFKGPITTAKWAKLTSYHIDTANRDIKALVSYGFLKQEEGMGKNTHYSLLLNTL